MLTATITGMTTNGLQLDEQGRRYITVYSDQARRAVRVLVANDTHAEMIDLLPRGARLTATGLLFSRGVITSTGNTRAYLQIATQQLKIHETSYDD